MFAHHYTNLKCKHGKDDICIKLLGDWKGGKQNKSNMSQLLKHNSFQQIPKIYIPILVLIIILGGHVPGQ
jgi:hypothetical protein